MSPRRRLGLRREAPILLPVALALFAILAITTLVSYQVAVERFALERQNEALALAGHAAEQLAGPGAPRLDRLLRQLPTGSAIALLDAAGAVLAAEGFASSEPPPPELLTAAARGASAVADPGRSGRTTVVALAPIPGDGPRRIVRLDLPAHTLAGQRSTLAILTPLVVGFTIAVSLVVTLFFRALLRPYQTLLERARAAESLQPADRSDDGDRSERSEEPDDFEYLLATFDRALEALGAPGGDLAPLAGSLGRELDGGFLLLDPERRVLVATPAATELLAVPGPPPGSALDAALAGAPGAAAELGSALSAAGRAARGTIRIGAGDRERAVGYTVEPLRGEGGRPRGWLVVVADLTEHERQRARERLADGLAQLGELSAGVAHELRNGLAALRGWLELARRPPAGDAADVSDIAESLDEIDRESRELTRVVDDFLAFARPGTGRREHCDLAAIVRRVVASATADPCEVTIETELPDGEATLAGDPLLLERALRNVVANAVRATADAGRPEPVGIRLAAEGERWRLSVSDRGAGVPATIRPRLFEPFVTGRPDGVGLGLALARRIVVLHGGEIAARDRDPSGTVVEMLLPSDVSVTESYLSASEAAPGAAPEETFNS